jgi:hypothetical protein
MDRRHWYERTVWTVVAGTAAALARTSARAAVAVALILAASTAGAHPDERVVDATLRLEPGEIASFPMSVHYHRLVATFRVHEPGASGLTLLVVPGAAATVGVDDGSGASADVAIELVGVGSLHHLIDCCLAIDFADYRLLVRNDGDAPASVDLRAWLVHDEFAVVVQRAEPGALEVPLALFLALGVSATTVSARGRRRRIDVVGGAGARSPGALPLAWSAGVFVWACALAAGLAVAGIARYGTGPIDGLIAIMADVPVPGGPFGSRAATVMGVLMLAWMASIGLWVRAVHAGAHVWSRWTARLGLGLAAVSLAAGVAMGWTYGAWAVPLGLALVLAVPLAACSLALRQRRAAPALSET